MTNATDHYIREAKRIEEDSLYSAKGHFVASTVWRSFHFIIGVPTAVLAALAGASALSTLGNGSTIAGILAIIVTALTAVTTFLNPNEKSTAHLNAGNRYNALRNQARIFWEIEANNTGSSATLFKRLSELASVRDDLNQNSPPIPPWAFWGAKRSIAAGEATYEVDRTP